MTNFERAVDYIRTTVRQLPTGTASRFSVPRNVFRDVDQAGGARVDLSLIHNSEPTRLLSKWYCDMGV